MKTKSIAVSIALLLLVPAAIAQHLTKSPLPPGHPLVATWRIDLKGGKCFEEYEIRADGTKLSQSGEERNESEHSISVVPSSNGFYKWIDRITKNNGSPDCSGGFTKLGNVAVNYIRLHPSGQRFLLCEAEEMKSCFAEFYRKAQ
jgi:hypothetical protein